MNVNVLTSLLVLGCLLTATAAQFPESCTCPDDCICKLETGLISCDGQGLRHVPIELNSCSWPGIHTLNLSSNFIREIQEYSFSLLTNLTRLYIYENSIELIDRDAFVGLRSLEFLFLDANRISSLPYQVFRPLRKLKKLLLYDNFLTTFPFGIFSQQADLTTLALHSNRLVELKTEWFDDMPKLKELYLHDNRISDLSGSPFRSLHYLTVLFLNENRLTTLTGSAFIGLRRVTVLVLSSNQIATINNDVFLSTPQLQQLFLEQNQLTEINRLMFAPPVYLQQLRIYGNRISRISDGAFYRLRNLRLLSVYGNQISSVTPQTFVGLDSLNELVIHNNQITSLRNSTFVQSPLLQRLWLNSNRISCLESNVFYNLRRLSLLNLGYNQLTVLPDHLFQNTPELLYLLVNSNRLSSIGNKPFRNLPKLVQLALSSNPLEFLAEGCFDGSNTIYYFQFSRVGDENNVFRCDCSALWLHEWMNSRPLLSSALCGKPDQFAGQDIRTLQTASFGCESAILTIDADADCDNRVVARGSCLQLTCSSRPRGTLTWSRADGRPIRTLPPSCTSSSLCRQSVSGDGTLVLDNVTPEDNGYYICSASFLNQTAMKICRVTVADPPVLHGEPDEVFLNYPGPTARFSLNFSGTPKPNVSWYQVRPSRAEVRIMETGPMSRYLISDEGSLVILQTQLEDRGRYKAIISNGAGTVTAETQLYFFFDSPCRSRCLNGGQCQEIRQCSCPESYAGRYCEEFIGVTEALTEPPTQALDDLLSNTQGTTEITPLLATTPYWEPRTEFEDESGSASGSTSWSDSESGYWSGDLGKQVSDSEPGKDPELDNMEGDGANLADDEDLNKLSVNGGVAGGAKRRRRRSLVRLRGTHQDRHLERSEANKHGLKKSHDEKDHGEVKQLPIEGQGTSDASSDNVVFEYVDRYDSRADMLKFER